jgi:hypothetical protein
LIALVLERIVVLYWRNRELNDFSVIEILKERNLRCFPRLLRMYPKNTQVFSERRASWSLREGGASA